MIPADERLLTLTESVAHLATRGVVRSEMTLRHWAGRGVRGVRLETLHVGGRVYTSAEALQRFFEATTPTRTTPEREQPRLTAAQQRRHDAAMERLRSLGCKV